MEQPASIHTPMMFSLLFRSTLDLPLPRLDCASSLRTMAGIALVPLHMKAMRHTSM